MSQRQPGLVRVGFRRVGATVSGTGPSGDAFYVVTQSTNAPTNAVNLGSLSTGILQITVAGGVATFSTTALADAFYVVTRATNAPANATNLGALSSGMLSIAVSAGVATVSSTAFAPGQVPFGAAAGGVLTSTARFFYEEVNLGGTLTPRVYWGTSTTLDNQTNTGASAHLYTAVGNITTVLRLQQNYTAGTFGAADIQFVAGPQGGVGGTEWLVGKISSALLQGPRYGSIVFSTAFNSGDFQFFPCGSFENGGLRLLGPLFLDRTFAIDPGTFGDLRQCSFIRLTQGVTIGPVAASGSAHIRFNLALQRAEICWGFQAAYAFIARRGRGVDVAAASLTTLGNDGDFFHITTGTGTINYIQVQDRWADGERFELYFANAVTLTHNAGSVPGNSAHLLLSGGQTVTMPAGSKISFRYDTNLVGLVEIGQSSTFVGTPGSVVFVGSTGLLAQDNANFFFSDSTNALYLGANSGGAGAGGALYLNTQSAGISPTENLITVTTTAARDKYFFGVGGGPAVGDATARAWIDVSPNSTTVTNGTAGTNWLTMRIRQQTFTVGAGAASLVLAATVWIDGPPIFTGTFGTGYANEAFHVDSGISTFVGLVRVRSVGLVDVAYFDGPNQRIGFFGASNILQQTSGANLTNSVTAGGTDDTIANYTDLTTYANDANAIRNDIYQLARKLKQVNDGLRTYGLLS